VNPLTCQAAVHAASEHEAADIDGTVDMPDGGPRAFSLDNVTNTKDPTTRYRSLHGPSDQQLPA
jgi:hypothetical protein